MQAFTRERSAATPDEIWWCEHDPVFSLGRHANPAHLLMPGNIPIVQSDRGGQVTYHGPGQLMGYCLINLRARKIGPAALVSRLEAALLDLLTSFGIQAELSAGRPGIYVQHHKICSLGLRIKEGFSYHGFALNVDMDLAPFSLINPCGESSLQMTMLTALSNEVDLMPKVKSRLVEIMQQRL